MRKLILMSVLVMSVAAPWRYAREPNAQRGVSRTVRFMVLFLVAWAVIGTRLFFLAPPPAD
jgi:hypothetical protein